MSKKKKAKVDKNFFYKTPDFSLLIKPEDLLLNFDELSEMAVAASEAGLPEMLVSVMFTLALEIEIIRKNALAIMNPDNPEPMTITIPAINRRKEWERDDLIGALRKAGWLILPTDSESTFEFSVKKFSKDRVELETTKI